MARHDASVRQIKSPYGPPYPRHSHCVRPRAVTRSVCVLHRVLNSFSSSSSSSLAVPPSLSLSLSVSLSRPEIPKIDRSICSHVLPLVQISLHDLHALRAFRSMLSLSLSLFLFFPFFVSARWKDYKARYSRWDMAGLWSNDDRFFILSFFFFPIFFLSNRFRFVHR